VKAAAAWKNKSIQRWRVLHIDLRLYDDATLSHTILGIDPDGNNLVATTIPVIVTLAGNAAAGKLDGAAVVVYVTRSSHRNVLTVPITVAPRTVASCTSNCPMPPAAACTSTESPGCTA